MLVAAPLLPTPDVPAVRGPLSVSLSWITYPLRSQLLSENSVALACIRWVSQDSTRIDAVEANRNSSRHRLEHKAAQ